jgi:hypothetical protein
LNRKGDIPVITEQILKRNELKRKAICPDGCFFPIGVRFKKGVYEISLKLFLPKNLEMKELQAALYFYETSNVAEPIIHLALALVSFLSAFVLCFISYFCFRRT